MAMSGYGAATYGQRIAAVYDEWHPTVEPEVLDTLESLANGGRVLELAVGTGRIALPLAARGLDVHGLDASEEMVAKLRAKPGGAELPVVMGDIRDVKVEGTFSLVFVAFNTFFCLLTQEDQVRCFRNCAARLEPEGVFALEVFVPDPGRFDRGQRTQVSRMEEDHVMLDVSLHDPVTQVVTSQHVYLAESGTRLFPVKVRYAWPCELDLMAQLAGLRLRERWADWDRSPFTAASAKHVSVYGR